MNILDSPLNKAGKVKAIYIRTHKNVLISVNPKVNRAGTQVRHISKPNVSAAPGRLLEHTQHS